VGAKTAVGYGRFEIQAVEEVGRLELEAEERRKEEERKRAEFETMSPEERDIAALNDPDIAEQQIIEIYNRIDSFSEENKKHAALSLKAYWEGHEKWKKKGCSKKQWMKVQKIKTVLGDE
jgi:hypothetical protein